MMKTFFALNLFLFSFPVFSQSLYIEYNAPFSSILIEENKIIYTEQKNTFDNPVSSIPSSSETLTKTGKLGLLKLKEIQKTIEKSGFMGLNDSYGAPESQRHYPYSILVKTGLKEKKVTYRSNPSYEKSPRAFDKIQKYLNDLVKELK